MQSWKTEQQTGIFFFRTFKTGHKGINVSKAPIPMQIQWIQWIIQHPPIIAERDDNDENYDLTQISYKWVLNLRSDHDNGSDIFHGGSLQTNDRKDWLEMTTLHCVYWGW